MTRPTRVATAVACALLAIAAPLPSHAAGEAHVHDDAAPAAPQPHVHDGAAASAAAAHVHGDAAPTPVKQLYTCGMHPQVIRDRPGTCPICGMELVPIDAARHSDAARPPQPGASITIDPAIVQNMGVRTAEVVEGPLVRRVRATGILAEAQPKQHDVNLRVSGWVQKLYADVEGMRVRAGEPLFDLYSPELQVAIGELIAARRSRDTHSVGAPLLAAATQKLELLGLPRAEIERLSRLEQPPATVTFRSPIDGYVVEKPIVTGDAVEAGSRALRVVDYGELWLDLRIFEQDLPALRIGQAARARLASQPGKPVDGTISFIQPQVDPTTRTTTARVTLQDPGFALRPGMYATVDIEAEVAPRAVLAPREAVIDTGSEQVVFLAHDGGHFEPRKIAVGTAATDGRVEILDGLAPGDVVVTSGQFLLDAESNMREALQRFLGAPGHVH